MFLTFYGDGQQIVGRERRERVSQLAWCGGGCFDSRRRVNSDVGCLSFSRYMKLRSRTKNPLLKRAKKGFRGYPVATIAFYGPDDLHATKVAVGIVTHEGGTADILERWYADDGDIRSNEETARQIQTFLLEHQVVSVAIVDRIIRCPHGEAIDYPSGDS